MEPTEATAALAAMHDSRVRLAVAANCPPQRHLAFALVLGSLVASEAAPPFWTMAIEAVLLFCIALIVLWDRKRTGMFINGYRAGRTRPLTLAMLTITLTIGAVGVLLKQSFGLVWAPVVCGLVVAVLAYFMSRFWQRIYRRELSETL